MIIATLAAKLKNAREKQGISQEKAAKALGVPRTAITQIEAAKRSVSTLELTKFAKLYKQNITTLLDEGEPEEELEVLLYRAVGNTPAFKQQILRFIELCKAGIELERILGHETWSKPPHYNLPTPLNKNDAVMQGETVANQERKRLGLGIEPIADITNLILNQQIWVAATNLPEEISGLFFNSTQTGIFILVNGHHAVARKRFSYAHEYAHVLFDCDDSQMRVSSKENHSELVEVRANAFAAAFLMPADGVNEFLHLLNKGKASRQNQVIFDVATAGQMSSENRIVASSQIITYQDVTRMAHRFEVSYPAAVYRLRSLNFISMSQCDALIEKYSEGKKFLKVLNMFDDLENKGSETLYERELINEIACCTIEAYRRQEISRGRVLELGNLLGIGGKNLYELAAASTEAE